MKQNFAFISYNHRDVKWAKWLRRKLEWYRLPSEIHNEFEDSRYIRPVFRDRDELDSGVLGEELRQRLENSKFLIVICSPNSAQSEWVSDEVRVFIEMGRLEYIIPFIIDGFPQTYVDAAACEQPLMGECFPKSLRLWNTTHVKDSLLGISVTDDGETNKQKSFIRIVSSLLEVSFDTLWKRHKREVRTMISLVSVVCVVALVLAYWFMTPVNLKVTIMDDPSSLPGMDSGILIVDGNEYSVTHPDTTIEVGNFPGYYRTKDIEVAFKADRFYMVENKIKKVTAGISQTEILSLHRDSTFAHFAGQVVAENSEGEYVPVENAQVSVADKVVKTDFNGYFSVTFLLSEQTETKSISVSKENYKTIVREDEVPSKELKYILHQE